MIRILKAIVSAAALASLSAIVGGTLAQGPGDALELGFKNPPDSAKPRTWWHWTGSNITKEGITKDLEWMKRAGIAGFQLADVSMGSGQAVDTKIAFGTPEWLDAVRHVASEADRLGLEMAIFSSAGWSETGGPWVKPEQAMKKLVWSETAVEGPRSFIGKLPQPPSNNGPIRNLSTGAGRGKPAGAPAPPPDPTYYGDSAVVAYRTPAEEVNLADLHPKVTTNTGAIDAAALLDDDLNTAVTIPAPEGGGPAWVQYEFAQPFRARAVSIAGRGGIPVGRVLASDHGTSFQTLAVLPGPQGYRGGSVRTFAFPETNARFYRLELSAAPLSPAAVMNGGLPLAEVLASLRVPRDFEYSRALDSEMSWIHRQAGDTDIFFVANRTDRFQDTEARFRVRGKAAELWHPDTGAIEPAEYTIADGRTTVPLRLAERESVFVVFRRAPSSPSRRLPRTAGAIMAALSGPWEVSFPPNLGAPAKIQLQKLEPWTANQDDGVKYFSGTATYTKSVEVPPTWFRPEAKILLDLGMVKDLAEVSVNGKTLGTWWKPPYQVDVAGVLKPGANQLEIKVTNEWTNRQMGDRLAPVEKRVLATAGVMMGGSGRGPQTPPESGLIGPVTVVSVETASAPATMVAGIPVNYDEARAGSYALPNPLVLINGKQAILSLRPVEHGIVIYAWHFSARPQYVVAPVPQSLHCRTGKVFVSQYFHLIFTP